mgnify:CR=1 FL=1
MPNKSSRASGGGSVNLPVGEWVDVPEGMVAAPDTYVDSCGARLREKRDSANGDYLRYRQSSVVSQLLCIV